MHTTLLTVECPQCEAYVSAEVIHSYDIWLEETGYPILYSFMKCPKCLTPLVSLQEDLGDGWDAPLRIYPPQEKGINPNLPKAIKNSFQEAKTCFRTKAYTATAIMCRKTLEGLCNAHNIKSRNLADGLRKMKEEGIIDKNLFDWAEVLRIFGNEAAHDVEVTFSPQDAKDVLEFTDAILEYVFTYKDKFIQFVERRNSRGLKSTEIKPH